MRASSCLACDLIWAGDGSQISQIETAAAGFPWAGASQSDRSSVGAVEVPWHHPVADDGSASESDAKHWRTGPTRSQVDRRVLWVSRSDYFDWRTTSPSSRLIADDDLENAIRAALIVVITYQSAPGIG